MAQEGCGARLMLLLVRLVLGVPILMMVAALLWFCGAAVYAGNWLVALLAGLTLGVMGFIPVALLRHNRRVRRCWRAVGEACGLAWHEVPPLVPGLLLGGLAGTVQGRAVSMMPAPRVPRGRFGVLGHRVLLQVAAPRPGLPEVECRIGVDRDRVRLADALGPDRADRLLAVLADHQPPLAGALLLGPLGLGWREEGQALDPEAPARLAFLLDALLAAVAQPDRSAAAEPKTAPTATAGVADPELAELLTVLRVLGGEVQWREAPASRLGGRAPFVGGERVVGTGSDRWNFDCGASASVATPVAPVPEQVSISLSTGRRCQVEGVGRSFVPVEFGQRRALPYRAIADALAREGIWPTRAQRVRLPAGCILTIRPGEPELELRVEGA